MQLLQKRQNQRLKVNAQKAIYIAKDKRLDGMQNYARM